MPFPIKATKIVGYNHIIALNGFTLPKDRSSFFKYMPFSRLKKNIEDKKLVFVTPSKWIDPFEILFYKTDFKAHHYQRENITCMCLTSKSTTNEETCLYSNCKPFISL